MGNMPDSKPLRIGFVSNSAWSIYNFRLDVIRCLLGQGHEVVVMAADDEFSPLLTAAGCRFVPIQFNNRTSNPLSDYLFYLHLKKLYREHQPGLVFHFVIKP